MRSSKAYVGSKFVKSTAFHKGEKWLRGLLLAGAVPLVLALAACGGSKSKPSPSEPPVPPKVSPKVQVHLPPVPAGWQTDRNAWAASREFKAQAGLATINADYAYARAITGEGITIGFIDTGLAPGHLEFTDKTIALNDRSGLSDIDNSQLKHGTGVASIALGARGQGSGMHGVAFDANPAMWSLQLTDGYLTVNDTILTAATRALESTGARIINQSWGYNSILNPDFLDSQKSFLRQSYGDFLAQMRRGKAIHVWAAGNDGEAQVSVSAAWPIIFPDLAGYAIAVAALGADGTIGRQTNHCGAARSHCLTAPGGVAAGDSADTIFAQAGGGYRFGYGTSYAAPFVSGVLALMMQAYGDQLTLPEYTARLLGTANKSGIYADASIYGQGVVDAQAALAPYGDTHIPLPAGGIAGPSDTKITDGELPSEMMERLKREKIIVLDALNTPFETPLISPLISLEPRLKNTMRTAWLRPRPAAYHPARHPVLAQFTSVKPSSDAPQLGAWQFSGARLLRPRGTPTGHALQGASLMAHRNLENQKGWLEVGVAAEQDSWMSSAGEGALRFGPAFSGLASLRRDFHFGQHDLHLEAHVSLSQLHGAPDSLLSGSTRAVASSLSLAWQYQQMRFSLRQPTYFETGELSLSLPYRRLAGGGILFRQKRFALQAEQRPLQVALVHEAPTHQLGIKLEKQAGLAREIQLAFVKRF